MKHGVKRGGKHAVKRRVKHRVNRHSEPSPVPPAAHRDAPSRFFASVGAIAAASTARATGGQTALPICRNCRVLAPCHG